MTYDKDILHMYMERLQHAGYVVSTRYAWEDRERVFDADIKQLREEVKITIAVLNWESDLPDFHSWHVVNLEDSLWTTWGDLDEYMATGVDHVKKWNRIYVGSDKFGGKVTQEMADKFRSFMDEYKKSANSILIEADDSDDG